jgi:UDP-N-acetylglucosamine--N-acetylmuramyl-(pentapeptide) pyrophosphoryl-undecaprenol N-acetylglucosamine transferase
VFGGSQGARIMADIVPPGIAQLEQELRARLSVVQQAREEDLDRVREAYIACGVQAEVAPFFKDLPARIAAAHLVVSRAGASTVSELAGIGRPAVLVPLPHALDQDQRGNASALAGAGGAILLPQDEFTPERVRTLVSDLAASPDRLSVMAAAARRTGVLDAADRLAELVLQVGDMVPAPMSRAG